MNTPVIEKPSAPTITAPLRRFEDLPGPRGVPVFGNLLQIDSTRMHQQLESWCDEHGPRPRPVRPARRLSPHDPPTEAGNPEVMRDV